jgi:hypothetical protein
MAWAAYPAWTGTDGGNGADHGSGAGIGAAAHGYPGTGTERCNDPAC